MVGFYIFMLLMTLLIPATMLFFGFLWQKRPPSSINMAYGYRTKRSMTNRETWIFAHMYLGKLYVKHSCLTAAFAILVMAVLAFLTLDTLAVGTVGGVVVCLQLIPFITSSLATERALKREFKN